MRRLATLLVLVGLLMLVAIPAMAQSSGESDPVTWEALGTVAGASIGAGVIVQVAGILLSLSARAKRIIAVLSGLAIVVTVTITTADPPTVAVVGLAGYNGMIAGLAASKLQESFSHGLDHRVSDAPS